MSSHLFSPVIDPAPFHPDAVSEETARFVADLEAMLADLPGTHEVPVEETRRARAEGKSALPTQGPCAGSVWQEIGGGRKLRISPAPGGAPKGIHLHIHGGGWTLGSPDYFDAPCQGIAAGTGMTVVSVQYRLAPEAVWPAQLDDCMAALDWVLAEWPDLPVTVGGESAGGHLSATVLQALRRRGTGLERMRGAVFSYGLYDMRMCASLRNWGTRKLILNTPMVAWFIDNVLPEGCGTERDDPAVSPILAPLDGMPPALFQVGTEDPLKDDTLAMAARWAGAGHRADLAIYPGGVHAFDAFPDLTIAKEFQARQIAFLAGCL